MTLPDPNGLDFDKFRYNEELGRIERRLNWNGEWVETAHDETTLDEVEGFANHPVYPALKHKFGL